jgi:hypothetical protein
MMTWGKASPVLALSGVFWLLQLAFQWFWLLGPVLIGVGSGAIASYYFGSAAGYVTGAVSGFLSGLVGSGSGAFEVFGFVMAMAIGLCGWLFVMAAIAWSDFRLLRENAWGMLGLIIGFCISEIPVLGSVPSLPVAVWRMYGAQIRADREALAAWRARREEFERAQGEALMLRIQEARSHAAAERAANDDEAIPETAREAA